MKRLLTIVAIVLTLPVTGCGGGTGGSEKVKVTELGIFLYAPPGWRVDSHNPRLFFRGNSTGIILDEQLEGKVFGEYVQQISEADMGKVISTTPLSIGRFDAIQTVIEYPNAGSKAIKVHIHKDDRLIEVSFVTPAGEFSKYETSLRKSIASISVE